MDGKIGRGGNASSRGYEVWQKKCSVLEVVHVGMGGG